MRSRRSAGAWRVRFRRTIFHRAHLAGRLPAFQNLGAVATLERASPASLTRGRFWKRFPTLGPRSEGGAASDLVAPVSTQLPARKGSAPG